MVLRRRTSVLRPRRSIFESLEQRTMLAAQPILTEFVASNDSTLNDGFGDDSDWIEIYNAGDVPIDLQGYHLTDNLSSPTKWSFTQSTVLDAKEYLVVFASGDDTIDPAGYWHTNFKLSSGGEYVGLASPTGSILSDFGLGLDEYPPQVTDIAYGLPGPVEQTLLAASDDVQHLVPSDGTLGTNWTNRGFDAAANGFATSGNGIGYENSPGSSTSYANLINTPVAAGTTTVYVRSEFNLVDASDVVGLSLDLQVDDGFAAYLNGTYLFGENEPAGPLVYNSAADGGRTDSQVLNSPVTYSLNAYLDLLQDGNNVIAFHALNNSDSSDMLFSAELTAQVGDVANGVAGYLVEATPGVANSQTMDLGPSIQSVEFSPSVADANAPIIVTAEIEATEDPFDTTSPKFYYRVNYDSEIQVAFVDNGTGADATAGDGIYSGQIPSAAFSEGDMVRWYITASDTDGTVSRAPRFADPQDSAEYFGTVILDPTASDDVPVMYWFVEDEAAAETREGTRASVFYRDVFYDNIHVDLHGQSTALPEFIKKSFDFDANQGEKFEIGDPAGKHSDFNLLTNYADQSKVRNTVAYAAFAEVGAPTHLAHPVSVHRNGSFYALYDFVEQGDSEYLRRLGLDTDGALYKVNNNLEDNGTAAYNEVEKNSRTYEDHSDFQEVVDASDLSGSAARVWYYDNLDIAEIINYLATQNVIQNSDFGHKNMYWYRDSNDTKLWQVLPWDVDLSFGHMWGFGANPPYFNNTLYTQENPVAGWNDIFQNFMVSNLDSRLREMYRRRVFSITEQLYGASGTAGALSWVYQQFQQWDETTADEAIRDMNEWGIHPNFTHTPAQAVDQIQSAFVVNRRNRLLSFAGSQSSVEDISIGTIEFAPVSGNQAEEYITLTNNNQSFATDLTGWTLSGAIEHAFKAGTVIPAGETLYVLADVQGFQARSSGPRGGQQLFTQGNYTGRLSNGGGTLILSNATGAQVDSETYVGIANNGDFDSDGDIDGSDFLAWQIGNGIASGAEASDGDANLDGAVNQTDLGLWQSNYAGTLAAITAQAESEVSEALGIGSVTGLVVLGEENLRDEEVLVQDAAISILEQQHALKIAVPALPATGDVQPYDKLERDQSEATASDFEELVDTVFGQSLA